MFYCDYRAASKCGAATAMGQEGMAVNFQQEQRRRGKGRPFAKGVSGNPAGRPVGSRNTATEMAQALT